MEYPYSENAPTTVAGKIVEGIICDLKGRSGIDHALGDLDDDIKEEIVSELTDIVEEGLSQAAENPDNEELITTLFESDQCSELTNKAAREIDRLNGLLAAIVT